MSCRVRQPTRFSVLYQKFFIYWTSVYGTWRGRRVTNVMLKSAIAQNLPSAVASVAVAYKVFRTSWSTIWLVCLSLSQCTTTETLNKEWHQFKDVKEFGISIPVVPKKSTAVLEYSFDVSGYRTYWQEWGEISWYLWVLTVKAAVGNRKRQRRFCLCYIASFSVMYFLPKKSCVSFIRLTDLLLVWQRN
jgi:hypothetical protein